MTESDPPENRNQRAMKRRKTDSAEGKISRSRGKESFPDGISKPPSTSSATAQPPLSAEVQIPEDKLALWLAQLSRQELEMVAAGATWNPGDPHNAECFLCKHAGGLIECRRCPRAYCKGCIMASSREPGNFDSWDCPACVLLGLGEARDDAVVDQPPTKPTVEAVNSKLHPPTPTPAHAIAAENIKGVSQPSSSYIQIVTNRRSETPTKAGMSLDSKAVKLDQERGKKRSRYSTLPSEVDEALAIINRELEAASYSKSIIAHTEARLHVAEQDLAIERGKSALAVPNVNQDEICKLQDELKRKNAYIEQLLKEKAESQAEASKYASKVRELEDWKRRMKMMIDGTAES